MSEGAGILNERLMKLAYGGEDVDSFDEPNGSENTVSSKTRRLTSQWGLPAHKPLPKNDGFISRCKCHIRGAKCPIHSRRIA